MRGWVFPFIQFSRRCSSSAALKLASRKRWLPGTTFKLPLPFWNPVA